MSANANNGDGQLRTQQGDSITMYFFWYGGENGAPCRIPEGYGLIFGFYDKSGVLLTSKTIGDNNYNTDHDCYAVDVSHDESVRFIGKVKVEVTLFSSALSKVDHGSKVVTLYADQRQNNKLI